MRTFGGYWEQFWLADIVYCVLTKQGKWVGWGYNSDRKVNVHMNGWFVDLARITSQKTKS
jgi:hypothetical protein